MYEWRQVLWGDFCQTSYYTEERGTKCGQTGYQQYFRPLENSTLYYALSTESEGTTTATSVTHQYDGGTLRGLSTSQVRSGISTDGEKGGSFQLCCRTAELLSPASPWAPALF